MRVPEPFPITTTVILLTLLPPRPMLAVVVVVAAAAIAGRESRDRRQADPGQGAGLPGGPEQGTQVGSTCIFFKYTGLQTALQRVSLTKAV